MVIAAITQTVYGQLPYQQTVISGGGTAINVMFRQLYILVCYCAIILYILTRFLRCSRGYIYPSGSWIIHRKKSATVL